MQLELTSEQVKSEQLGCLGLIAAVIEELGIVEKIDARLSLNKNKGGLLSYGRRVAAMVLNGLGFMNSRLYMTSHFFQDKPVAQLLNAEVTAVNLNDDCLGRCLDKIADYGTTQLFSEVAFEIASEKGLLGQRLHVDTTSLLLYGRYEDDNSTSPQPNFGYSKAHRQDLKQVILSMAQGGAANLPLWMEALDGNSSDKASFHETVKKINEFSKLWTNAPDNLCFVLDSAFYDQEKIRQLGNVHWITRVPNTVKLAKEWLLSDKTQLEWQIINEDYQLTARENVVNEITHRWVMVFSKPAYARQKKTLMRRMDKAYDMLNKTLWHLSNKLFSCASDAQEALNAATKKLKYHQVHANIEEKTKNSTRGRSGTHTEKQITGYQIQCSIATDLKKLELHFNKLGYFVLATNQLNSAELSNANILEQYKEQSQVEAGFKFIKSDTFELDSVFLKTPKRIGALMMIMTLCLMVYNFAQYHLRKCLKDNNEIVPNQVGKAVQNPTMKWIAELMAMIAVVTIEVGEFKQRIVTNVKQVHKNIITYFGPAALRIYGLPPDQKTIDIDYANFKNLLDWCEM